MTSSEKPTHLDLFSGIGGFALAAQWAGFRTVAFVEIDAYCQRILRKNFGAEVVANSKGRESRQSPESEGREDSGGGSEKVLGKNFLADAEGERESAKSGSAREGILQPSRSSRVRIHSNIFDLDGTQFRGVSLITGGFPCQPFSVAGKRGGAADDRAIWPQMFRVISEARPAWVLGENVPGIIPMELDNVLSDLEGIGYATRAFVIPACAVDARHRRDRLWIIGRKCDAMGDSKCNGFKSGSSIDAGSSLGPRSEAVSIASLELLNGSGRTRRRSTEPTDCCRWLPEPDVCLLAHAISKGLDEARLTTESTYTNVVRGASTESRSAEILSRMWQENGEKVLQRHAGKHEHLHAPEILRHGLHGESLYDACTESFRDPEKAKAVSEIVMRAMRSFREARDSSQGQRLEEQRKLKFNDAVFLLSHIFASCSGRHLSEASEAALHGLRKTLLQTRVVQYSSDTPETVWQSLPCADMEWEILAACLRSVSWSEWPDVPRVSHGTKERVNRLKGLGNAIVPQVAYEILREIRNCLTLNPAPIDGGLDRRR